MTWMGVCVALVVMAVWLALPDPRAGLRRLDGPDRHVEGWRSGSGVSAGTVGPAASGRLAAGPRDPGGGWRRVLAGRPGAPPLRHRTRLAVGAGLLCALVAPDPVGLGMAVCAGLATLLATGWLWPVWGPDPAVGEQLPGTLDLLAACLAAGAPMRGAVESVAAVSEPETVEVLDRVAGQLQLGRAEPAAWLALAEDHWWGAVAKDVARSARSGTSLVSSLHVHATDSRRRWAAERARQARAVGVRSVVPLMACFLPAFVLVGVVPIIAGLLSSFFG